MTKTIHGKTYCFGRNKNTKQYCIHEVKNFEWFLIAEFNTLDDMKKHIRHLVKLGQARQYRQAISDICGTSYACAKRDMGF
jgi:hypothetical protein